MQGLYFAVRSSWKLHWRDCWIDLQSVSGASSMVVYGFVKFCGSCSYGVDSIAVSWYVS